MFAPYVRRGTYVYFRGESWGWFSHAETRELKPSDVTKGRDFARSFQRIRRRDDDPLPRLRLPFPR